MTETVWGVVRNGLIVPSAPIPEGTSVEIRVCEQPQVPPELQAEFDAWEQSSSEALELVERMAKELERDEKR